MRSANQEFRSSAHHAVLFEDMRKRNHAGGIDQSSPNFIDSKPVDLIPGIGFDRKPVAHFYAVLGQGDILQNTGAHQHENQRDQGAKPRDQEKQSACTKKLFPCGWLERGDAIARCYCHFHPRSQRITMTY